MVSVRLARVLVCAMLLLGPVSAASAQGNNERPLVGTFGYMFTRGEEGYNVPFGLFAQLSREANNPDRNMEWLGQIDFARKSDDFGSNSIMHVEAGARLKFPRMGVTPFVQFMAGLARDSFGGDDGFGDFSYSDTALGISLGGGVKVPRGSGGGGFHIGADYRRDFYSSGYNSFGVYVGYSLDPFESMSPSGS